MAAAKRFEERKCRYFRKPGKVNTAEVLEAAAARAVELGIACVIVPSVSGRTALAAREAFGKGVGVIAVGQGTQGAGAGALMAAAAGLGRTDTDGRPRGGPYAGADTALVIRPANSARFFDLKVREVICKPREF
jgi:hypothetical protein